MIIFNYETDFKLANEDQTSKWLMEVLSSESKTEGNISYVFCNDEYLHKLNMEYLKHDTLTDIITFDYSIGNEIHGDVFISIERVTENAVEYSVDFNNELLRVMSHGLLHLAGYKDKIEADIIEMRKKENDKIAMFHVER